MKKQDTIYVIVGSLFKDENTFSATRGDQGDVANMFTYMYRLMSQYLKSRLPERPKCLLYIYGPYVWNLSPYQKKSQTKHNSSSNIQ